MHIGNTATKLVLLFAIVGILFAIGALLATELYINRFPPHDAALFTAAGVIVAAMITGFPGLVSAVMSIVNFQHTSELKADVKANTEITQETREAAAAAKALGTQNHDIVQAVRSDVEQVKVQTDGMRKALEGAAFRDGIQTEKDAQSDTIQTDAHINAHSDRPVRVEIVQTPGQAIAVDQVSEHG